MNRARMTVFGALALGTMLLAVPAGAKTGAKNCRKLCKNEIHACVSDAKRTMNCTPLRGKDKRTCNKARATAIHACVFRKGPIMQACAASSSSTTCSPSGAFVD